MNVYRKPCGGGRERQWPMKRGCFQQKRTRDQRVQKYANVTEVPNPTCPDDWDPSFTPPSWPTNVAPYVRPPSTGDTTIPRRSDGKVPTDSDYCDEGHGHGIPPGPWRRSDFPSSCFDGAQSVDVNCYSIVPGEYLDLSSCRKLGFKNVQARHWWHGRFGFESLDGTSTCGVEPADMPATPDAQKFLTVRVYAKHSQSNDGEPESDFSYEYDRTFTVNRFTGVITQSGPGLTISTTEFGAGAIDNTIRAEVFTQAMGMGALNCAANFDSEWIFEHTEYPTETQTVTQIGTFTRSNTEVVRTLTSIGTGPRPADNSISIQIASATLSDPFAGADLVDIVQDLLAEWDMADDLIYPWRLDPFTTVAPLVEYDGVMGIVTPLSGSQNGSLGQGDDGWIDPNAERFDGSIIGSPVPHPGAIKVTQSAGAATDFFGPSITPALSSTGILDGRVLQLAHQHVTVKAVELRDGGGALLATGVEGVNFTVDAFLGQVTIRFANDVNDVIIDSTDSPNTVWISYDFALELGGHFDHRHETWNYGDDACGSNIECLAGYGAWSGSGLTLDPTDYYVPRCATHWTQNNAAHDLPHGAFQIYSAGTGELIMQKWAEIKIPRPSQNFFGPCGAQRYELKATHTSCVQNAVNDPPLITVSEGEGSRFEAGDDVIYWTGDGTGGAHAAEYIVESVVGDDVQLSTKVANVPALWNGGPLLGVLRWASDEVWPICGRVPISSIFENRDEDDLPDGTLTVNLATPTPFLRTGDTVDFTRSDATHPEIVGYGDVPIISVVDDRTFVVARETFSGLGPDELPTATHLKSHGAPGYWWYDVKPKGDFIFAKWGYNWRDISIDPALRANQAANFMPQAVNEFFATTDCVPFTPCWPQVMAITPNHGELDDASVDDFPNGTVYGFDSLTLDGRYGSQWQAIVQQVMDDIYWVAPIKPCSDPDDDLFGDTSKCGWKEDDGGCAHDTCLGIGEDGDGDLIYAHRPIVEARAAMPVPWQGDSAPTLPNGIHIGYATLDELEAGEGQKPVLLPPGPVGSQLDRLNQPNPTMPQWCPWNFYVTQQGCVCAGGRFAAEYILDGVIC